MRASRNHGCFTRSDSSTTSSIRERPRTGLCRRHLFRVFQHPFRMETLHRGRPGRCFLNLTQHHQDHYYYEYRADETARTPTPVCAMGPTRQRTEEQQNQDNDEERSHSVSPMHPGRAAGTGELLGYDSGSGLSEVRGRDHKTRLLVEHQRLRVPRAGRVTIARHVRNRHAALRSPAEFLQLFNCAFNCRCTLTFHDLIFHRLIHTACRVLTARASCRRYPSEALPCARRACGPPTSCPTSHV